MRKSIVIAAVLTLLVNIVSTVAAAGPTNPFGDVPAKHWSYAAVNQLKQDGIIDGDGQGTFGGDRTVTRYEMAQMIARAIWNAEKANAENKVLIDKLSAEFTSELTSLGVRVATLEKKSDKITVSGFLHLSDQVWDNSGSFAGHTATTGDTPHPNDGHYPAVGIDLYVNYKINDKWQVKIENEAVRDFRTGGFWTRIPNGDGTYTTIDGTVSGSQRYDQMYAEGLVGATTVKAGRFDYGAAYGLMVTPGRKGINGVQFAVGDQNRTTLTYGYFRQGWTGNATNPYLISNKADNRYAAIEFDAPIAKDLNVKTAYHNLATDGSDTSIVSDNINLWEVGVDKMIGKKLNLFATYGESDANSQNKAYMAGITYGRADLNAPGSYFVTARYLNAEAKASIAPDNYWVSKYDWGLKGPELTSQIIIDKNVDIFLWAASLKPTDGVHTGKLNTVKLGVDFYF
ncbi:S-layer homology domain-containing protein [Sporomusa malonica]|uniref:S-layer homology domain-containing protein n=1 Tax=Sporomusa malonica TaxID=112901 RepID=A0A1W2EXZ7_9FIRM|nr:S-layer homology domain-containing protein [Sporomusa malonica]SMD14569.1 S-layer homology domain-containing protein [Sporomusa malonica]